MRERMRKKKVVCVFQKADILEKLTKGISIVAVGSHCGVNKSY